MSDEKKIEETLYLILDCCHGADVDANVEEIKECLTDFAESLRPKMPEIAELREELERYKDYCDRKTATIVDYPKLVADLERRLKEAEKEAE